MRVSHEVADILAVLYKKADNLYDTNGVILQLSDIRTLLGIDQKSPHIWYAIGSIINYLRAQKDLSLVLVNTTLILRKIVASKPLSYYLDLELPSIDLTYFSDEEKRKYGMLPTDITALQEEDDEE
jgi:hypothetical protein